jgi:hypothetical protein
MSVDVRQYEAREIQAAFQIGNAQIPINHITLTHTIDELPYAEVSVQLDNKNATDEATRILGGVGIDITKFSKLSRVTQEKILNDFRINPDTQLAINDGEDPKSPGILMKGFLGRPQFRIREGDLGLSFTIVHAKSVLQAFNSGIYSAQQKYTFELPNGFFDFDAAALKVRQGDSIAARIKVIIEGLVRGAAFLPDLTDPSKYDTFPIHTLNLLVKDKVLKCLTDSIETTEIDGIGEPDFVQDNLNWSIFNTLINAPNFFQAIDTFCKTFFFQMNTSLNGDIWLEWQQQHTPARDRVITVPLQNVVFNMSNIFQLPVLQALVMGQGMDSYALSGDVSVLQGAAPSTSTEIDGTSLYQNSIVASGDAGIQLTTLAKYPSVIPRNAVGVFYLLAAPDWLNPDKVTYDLTSKLSESDKDTPRIKAVLEAFKKIKLTMTGAAATRQKVMNYMAKQAFRSMYLGETQGHITIPLNLKCHPGYTYQVKSVTGETLFTGYLKSVVHDIAITADGGAAALSSLTFSHVLAPGAVIRALEENPDFPTATTQLELPASSVPDKLRIFA